MNIAVVVIWYYPEKIGKRIAVQNILSYSPFCKKIFIVDNSPNDNGNLVSQIPNSQYIPNFDNMGIAKAQNQGCQAAMDDGYTWVMTMDQDSNWQESEFSLYLSEIERLTREDSSVVSFSPGTLQKKAGGSFFDTVKQQLKRHLFKKKQTECSGFEYTDRVLASGNIINLDAWKAAGRFNDDLFIDDVDYDFCYRLVRSGKRIVKIHKCKMNHTSGGKRGKTFFPRAYRYPKERIYYITRNKIFILKNYPEFAHKYKYRKEIARIISGKLFFLEFSCLKYAIKGIIDGRKGRLGKM